MREYVIIEREYNNPFDFNKKINLNAIKYIQILVYKFFGIKNFDRMDMATAITLARFVDMVYTEAKKTIYKITDNNNAVKQKKSYLDDLDKEEDVEAGIQKENNEEKEYYDNLLKYLMSLEHYCRLKRIDVNTKLNFLIENIRFEIEYDEEHKEDYKDL